MADSTPPPRVRRSSWPSPQPRLLVGRTCAALATSLIPVTLTLALIRIGSATELGLVLACELLPMLVLLPVAGVVADRLPPHRVVLAADLVRAAAQFGIGAELLSGSPRIPVLAALAAITGAAVAFGIPAVRTLVAAVIAEPDRLRMNARLGIAQGLAGVTAPAVAGGLVLLAGAGWASLLTGALFLLSAATVGGLAPRRDARPVPDRRRGAFLAESREGWAEIRRHPWFIGNVVAHGLWHFAAGLLVTLGPLIAVRDLGGESSWVIVVQIGTVGMVLGAYAATRLPLRHPLIAVAVGAAVYAFPLLAFALRLPVPVIAAAQFVGMFGVGMLSPLWETVLQRRVPVEMLGRVGSCDTLISFGARPLGLAVAAPLAALVGTTAPLLGAAVVVGAANLAVILLPGMKEGHRPERGPEPGDGPGREPRRGERVGR
ncbi:MFS transporter [Streptomyces sp. NPDC020965]|uniref:MFS transporter n=1 Tax=Streptomyces sp. NPDC020965 TaxID=3365105 RepID=UPI003794944A